MSLNRDDDRHRNSTEHRHKTATSHENSSSGVILEILQDANVDAAATRRILTKAAKGTRLPRSPGRSLTWYAAKGEKRE